MVRISIVCLVYRSKKLADWVYDSVHEFTPALKNGEAEFFFIANDPTNEILGHLDKKKYAYIINNNPQYTEEELFEAGYAKPEYIGRVYRGYNQGILNAKGDMVVLINSDNFFSPDWLENLVKYSDRSKVISSKIVERTHPKYSFFPGAYNENFGDHPDNFRKNDFLNFVLKNKKTGLELNGAYMPCLLYKDVAIQAGLYPEGNIAAGDYDNVKLYGDEAFYQNLSQMGIKHLTSMDSIVYHLKEGESDETGSKKEERFNHSTSSVKLKPYSEPSLRPLILYFTPCLNHTIITESIVIGEVDGFWRKLYKKIKNNIVIRFTLNTIYLLLSRLGLLTTVKKILGMTPINKS